VGAQGPLPQILDHPPTPSRARALQGRERTARRDRRRRPAVGPRRLRLLPGSGRGRRHRPGERPGVPDAAPADDHGDEAKPNRSLADYLAPPESAIRDHLGAFAVTAGLGADELAASYEAANDDYRAIMVKALADRLAEAFAEWTHQEARREWGYEPAPLAPEDLVEERYRGIRPAFGYPACPDHSEKGKLFTLLGATGAGLHLTENGAMLPAASVSGLYFAHPQARYFNVGRLGKDQVEEYARRKGESRSEAERWLRANLAYEPE